jgi:hypothetical protein
VPASDSFLIVATALLGIAAAWNTPWLRRTAGVEGLLLLALGALLPLLDPLRFALIAEDQIAYLTQDPVFTGPLAGLAAAGLAAAGGTALGIPLRRCLRWWGWAAAGVLLPILLASLTPSGAPWLAPFLAHRFAWPILPKGCMVLLALLALGLAGWELWPRRRTGLLRGMGIAATLLALAGIAGQAGLGSALPVPAGALREIEPDPFWPGRWLDVVVESDRYTAVTRGLGSEGDVPSAVPRWNDQTRLLQLLEDPVLRRFYFEVFRHPVVAVEATDFQIRLSMRELGDALVGEPGPTLVYETDAHGRHRQYRVERLD